VNRFLAAAVTLQLAFRAIALGQPASDVVQAQCFADGAVVARTSDFQLAFLRNERWQPPSPRQDAFRLWRSPDGRIFALALEGTSWVVVQILEASGPGPRWAVPGADGADRFASLKGIDVVTQDRVYRLDPGGKVTELGPTPIGGSGQPLHGRSPEIIGSPGLAVVCTGTSHHLDDYVGGSCREARGAYAYLVDFGEPLCCDDDEPDFTAPFVCGDAVISALRKRAPPPAHDSTQARALATGALLARRPGAARLGSTCLDGKRALLVGKREIQVVSVPSMRTLWRQKIATKIGAVAVCGGTRAFVIPKGTPYPVQSFDLE
jgi:hypothetical protein